MISTTQSQDHSVIVNDSNHAKYRVILPDKFDRLGFEIPVITPTLSLHLTTTLLSDGHSKYEIIIEPFSVGQISYQKQTIVCTSFDHPLTPQIEIDPQDHLTSDEKLVKSANLITSPDTTLKLNCQFLNHNSSSIDFQITIKFSSNDKRLEIIDVSISSLSTDEKVTDMCLLPMPLNRLFFSNPTRDSSEFSPIILIDAIFAGAGKNYGEVLFTVDDIKPYSGDIDCVSKIISENPTIYQTQFSKFPQFNSIIIGEGCTLFQKFMSIILCNHYTITISDFSSRMALYAYSKYILSRLLYGKFSLKFLVKSFNEKFQRDLARSRFSEFQIIYTDPQFGLIGFEQYFVEYCSCNCK